MKCSKYRCDYKGKSAKVQSSLQERYNKCPKCGSVQLKEQYRDYYIELHINKEQAFVIEQALECYSRMLNGQIDIALEPALQENWKLSRLSPDKYQAINASDIRDEVNSLKKKLFNLTDSSSFGIHNSQISDSTRVSYDIQQVLRNVRSWTDNPMGGFTVNYDKPMKTSKQELCFADVYFKEPK